MGNTVLVSVVSVVTTLINIFLDWLFVFPLKMGMKGAAIATGISQTIGMLVVIGVFIGKKSILRFRKFKFDKHLLLKMFGRGTPEAVNQFTTPIATLFTNHVLIAYLGEIYVNAFSIICYVASFSVAVFWATAVGLQPLFGKSYGIRT